MTDESRRTDRLRREVADVARRRAAGEVLADRHVINAHPDLMPELGRELDRLRSLRQALLAAQRAGPQPEPLELVPEDLLDAPIEVPPDLQDSALPGPPERPLSPPPSIEGYQLLHEVGGGGQAVVYKAMQESTGRVVAVKVIPGGPFVNSRRRGRFNREVEILAALHHPNIVGIIDRGRTSDGSFFLVMEYVDGHCLGEHAASNLEAACDQRALLRLFAKLAAAVGAAHERGIVHRDLKPSNVRVDSRGEPHVLDFGMARWLANDEEHPTSGRTITFTGQIVGSMPWACPEQADGSADGVDARGDVYALGVMLYVALTGDFPYPVYGPIREVLDNIAKVTPLPPSKAVKVDTPRGDIAPGLDSIVLTALAKRPQDRYASAGEMAADIERHLNGHEVAATRLSVTRIGRRRVALFACVALVALTTGSFVVALRMPRTSEADAMTVFELPEYENQYGMRFLRIPSGGSGVGSGPNEIGRSPDEMLQPAVIERPYFLSITEVTRGQYRKVVAEDAATSLPVGGDDLPVTDVTWEEAVEFCKRLSKLTGATYRLPTETEWEYACRAGSWHRFSGSGSIGSMGWYAGNSGLTLHPVANKGKNNWGLFDMHGNAEEWCADEYSFVQNPGKRTHNTIPDTRPSDSDAMFRSTRGGSSATGEVECRSAARHARLRDERNPFVGFRVVLEAEGS
jgi:formylglycine-generating enzyme required for sulfatase activity